MDVSGEYTFDAPQAMVWAALLDPNVLGSIMPGGKGFEQTAPDQYAGVLEVKVGPVQGTFQGQIKLSDIQAPEHYQMDVDGKGAPGFVKANGSLRLEARGNQTFMAYTGTAQVGGRIASVGQRLVESAARSIIRQSLDALNAYLKAQAEQPAPPVPVAEEEAAAPSETVASADPVEVATPAPVPISTFTTPVPVVMPASYKPPSQFELGLNVARDVFNDMVPAKYQPWLIGAIILIVLLLIWRIILR